MSVKIGRKLTLLVSVCVAMTLFATSANAGEIEAAHYAYGINYSAYMGETNNLLLGTETNGRYMYIYDRLNAVVVAGSGLDCTSSYGGKQQRCRLSSGNNLDVLTVDLFDGNDSAEITYEYQSGGDQGATGISGGTGADTLIGSSGNDGALWGGDGADVIYGGDGDDGIAGDDGRTDDYNHGNDTIYGGGGDDDIFPGGGADTIDSGSGNDNITSEGDTTSDSVKCGSGPSDTVLASWNPSSLSYVDVMASSCETVTHR